MSGTVKGASYGGPVVHAPVFSFSIPFSSFSRLFPFSIFHFHSLILIFHFPFSNKVGVV